MLHKDEGIATIIERSSDLCALVEVVARVGKASARTQIVLLGQAHGNVFSTRNLAESPERAEHFIEHHRQLFEFGKSLEGIAGERFHGLFEGLGVGNLGDGEYYDMAMRTRTEAFGWLGSLLCEKRPHDLFKVLASSLEPGDDTHELQFGLMNGASALIGHLLSIGRKESLDGFETLESNRMASNLEKTALACEEMGVPFSGSDAYWNWLDEINRIRHNEIARSIASRSEIRSVEMIVVGSGHMSELRKREEKQQKLECLDHVLLDRFGNDAEIITVRPKIGLVW